MKQISKADVIEICTSVALSFADSGYMARNLATYYENPNEILVIFNTRGVRYLIPQERGFKHYRSGKMVTVNKGFVSVKTAGKLEMLQYSNILGVPYNKLEDNQILIENRHLMMVESGVIKDG